MRRRVAALIVSVFALGLVFVNPWQATADHCDSRLIVYSRHSLSPLLMDLRSVGCTAGQHQNTARLSPGADQIQVLARQAAKQPVPVGGVYTTDNKTAEFELKSDAEDPAKASRHTSPYLPIGSTTKLQVTVKFDDGSEQSLSYTR